MDFTKQEMLDIVASVESEYDNLIKSEQESDQNLAKNEDNQNASGEDLKKYEYNAEDMEKMYAEMDKTEVKDHYESVKKVMAKMEIDTMDNDVKKKEQEDLAKAEELIKAKALIKAEAASEQDKISKMEMEKKEKEEKDKKDKEDMEKAEKEKMAKMDHGMEKSENETKLEAEIEKLKLAHAQLLVKSEDDVTIKTEISKFMKLIGVEDEAPSQKSITELGYIAKNEDGEDVDKNKEFKIEDLSKSEVTEILAKKSADPATENKDRKAINAYILENTDIKSIKHLLQGE